MADNVTVRITGMEELERQLLAMGQDFGAKSIVDGAYKANQVLQDAAKQNIVSGGSYDTGLLHKSIKRKKVVYDKDGEVVVVTGVSSSVKGVDNKGNPRVPWRYAHLVHKHNPFMKSAYDTTKQAVVDNFIQYLKQKIARHVKR